MYGGGNDVITKPSEHASCWSCMYFPGVSRLLQQRRQKLGQKTTTGRPFTCKLPSLVGSSPITTIFLFYIQCGASFLKPLAIIAISMFSLFVLLVCFCGYQLLHVRHSPAANVLTICVGLCAFLDRIISSLVSATEVRNQINSFFCFETQ